MAENQPTSRKDRLSADKARSDAKAADARARQAAAEAEARKAEAAADQKKAEIEAGREKTRLESEARENTQKREAQERKDKLERQGTERLVQIGMNVGAAAGGYAVGGKVAKTIKADNAAGQLARNTEAARIAGEARKALPDAGKAGKAGALARQTLTGVVKAADKMKLSSVKPTRLATATKMGLIPAAVLLAEGAAARWLVAPTIENETGREAVRSLATGSLFAAINVIQKGVQASVAPTTLANAADLASIETARAATKGQRGTTVSQIRDVTPTKSDTAAPKTVAELRTMAKEAGLAGASKANKATLIDKLKGAGKLALGGAIVAPAIAAGIAFDSTRSQAMAAGESGTSSAVKGAAAATVAGGAVGLIGAGLVAGVKALAKAAPTAGKLVARAAPVAMLGLAGIEAIEGYRKDGVKGAGEALVDFATFGAYSHLKDRGAAEKSTAADVAEIAGAHHADRDSSTLARPDSPEGSRPGRASDAAGDGPIGFQNEITLGAALTAQGKSAPGEAKEAKEAKVAKKEPQTAIGKRHAAKAKNARIDAAIDVGVGAIYAAGTVMAASMRAKPLVATGMAAVAMQGVSVFANLHRAKGHDAKGAALENLVQRARGTDLKSRVFGKPQAAPPAAAPQGRAYLNEGAAALAQKTQAMPSGASRGAPAAQKSPGGAFDVQGYTRRDGTQVKGYQIQRRGS